MTDAFSRTALVIWKPNRSLLASRSAVRTPNTPINTLEKT
jgi:hypothetical protein